MGQNKLFKAVIAGAIIGGIVSMFDRATRESTVATVKTTSERVKYYAQNRDELMQMVEGKIEQAQSLYDTAQTNITKLVENADQLKGLPETIQAMVGDTQKAFTKDETNGVN
ncbi:MAG: YtxH domain-containing protein [Caryophanon sp.]|nr:YtxH domain-containing protein [Caryophanon sp.]